MRAHPFGISLLFKGGERPDRSAVAEILEQTLATGMPCHVCSEDHDGHLALLASGLAFGLAGLKPHPSALPPLILDAYGFASDIEAHEAPHWNNWEAVTLYPDEHVSAGVRLAPVYRAMIGIAANVALHLPVQGLAWHPAKTLMEPRYFSRTILNWLSGGAFPALGLTAVRQRQNGDVESRGMHFFTGQEMQLEGRIGEPWEKTRNLALKLIDALVRQRGVAEACRWDVEGTRLLIEPSRIGQLLLVWREREGY